MPGGFGANLDEEVRPGEKHTEIKKVEEIPDVITIALGEDYRRNTEHLPVIGVGDEDHENTQCAHRKCKNFIIVAGRDPEQEQHKNHPRHDKRRPAPCFFRVTEACNVGLRHPVPNRVLPIIGKLQPHVVERMIVVVVPLAQIGRDSLPIVRPNPEATQGHRGQEDNQNQSNDRGHYEGDMVSDDLSSLPCGPQEIETQRYGKERTERLARDRPCQERPGCLVPFELQETHRHTKCEEPVQPENAPPQEEIPSRGQHGDDQSDAHPPITEGPPDGTEHHQQQDRVQE